jgi:nucleoside-diphosphate-sugar epimerase
MVKLVVIGASGIIGQEFVEQIVKERNYTNVFLLSSSERGIISLKRRFGDLENVSVDSIDVSVISKDDTFDVVNFAYSSTGLPWERIKAARILATRLICLGRMSGCRTFIEVGSQSVFGYKFQRDNTIYSKLPTLVPEYCITKQTMERLLSKGLQRSKTNFILVRLGNVITPKSAAFHKRLYQITFDDCYNMYNYDGYMNACFLENVIAGLTHILNNSKLESQQKIYHFAEITEHRWADVFNIIISKNELKMENNKLLLQNKNKAKIFFRNIFSNLYFIILRLMGFLKIPNFFNYYVVRIYRKYKLRNRGHNMYDYNLRCIFSEKHRFVNFYPASFSYVIEKKDHYKRLEEVYDVGEIN